MKVRKAVERNAELSRQVGVAELWSICLASATAASQPVLIPFSIPEAILEPMERDTRAKIVTGVLWTDLLQPNRGKE